MAMKTAILALAALLAQAGVAAAQSTPGSDTPLGEATAPERVEAVDAITARGVIRIGVTSDLPPFGGRDEGGGLVGYDIDVANLLARDLGVQAELVPLKSADRLASLLTHRIDLLVANLGVSPDRAKSIAFSTPYAPFFSGVFGAPEIVADGPAALAGKRVAVARDSLEDKELAALAPQANLLRFDDNKAAMDAYLAGQAELVATGNLVVADLLRRDPSKRIERKFIVRESPASIGVPRGQPHLLHWVNVFVFHKKLTGELDKLARAWFGAPLPPLPVL
jgi:polar amino acid transport system substrate-binding protein